MSRQETYESHLSPTCIGTLALLLAALGVPACQTGIATLDATPDILDAKVAAETFEQPAVTAVDAQRAAAMRESVTDQALKLRLNDALIFDPLLPPSEISLTVKDGHVKLTGSVGTFFDSVRAADVVSHFSLVSSVDNQLEVRPEGATLCLLGAR